MYLSHFIPLAFFFNPWNYQKIFGFLFSGVMEGDYWHELNKDINLLVEVFKNGPSKICEKQPLNTKQTILFHIFKGCLPQYFTWSILEYLDPYVTLLTNEFEEFLENIWYYKLEEIINTWRNQEQSHDIVLSSLISVNLLNQKYILQKPI